MSRSSANVQELPRSAPEATAPSRSPTAVGPATARVRVFLSHKHEDAVAASHLKNALVDLGPTEDFEVFLSEEIRGGDDWFHEIQRRLVESNLLLLLYTDREHDWDWCMYEAGLFTDLRGQGCRRVICLSSAGEAPTPLQHLQFVRADDPAAMAELLGQIFLDTELLALDEPLVPRIGAMRTAVEKAGDGLARSLCRRPVEAVHPGEHVFVHVQDPAALTAGPEGNHAPRIPAEAKVTSDSNTVWHLFDKEAGVWRWGDLVAELEQREDRRWLRELAEAMTRIRDRSRFREVQATFAATETGRMFRPVVYRANRQSDGSMVFKVLFSEYVGWRVQSFPPDLRILATSVIMASRFRYEVLERYEEWFRRDGDEAARRQIVGAIQDIEQEAASVGLLDRSGLLRAFDDPEENREIARMFDEWHEIREGLMVDLGKEEWESARQHLARLREMNAVYLSLATRRYHQVVSG